MKRLLILLLLFSSSLIAQTGNYLTGTFQLQMLRDSAGVIVTTPAGKPFVFVSPATGTAGYWTRGTAPNSGTVRVTSTGDTVRVGAAIVDGKLVLGGTSFTRQLTVVQDGTLNEIASFESTGGNVTLLMKDNSGTKYNWRFGAQSSIDQGFEITPSSAVGGTAFSTPALVIKGATGNTGLGVNAPTARLHLKAGTATANSAPLKFNSGTLLTSPEAGVVEFLTDAFYGTITTGAARKTFAFLEGTTTNDDAAAGNIGEKLAAVTLTGAAVSLTTTVTANIDSVSLTAGDWELSGQVAFNLSGATATDMKWGYSTTSATLGADTTYNELPASYAGVTSTLKNNIPPGRISISGTTKVYLVAQSTFTVGTVTAFGTIRARRMR